MWPHYFVHIIVVVVVVVAFEILAMMAVSWPSAAPVEWIARDLLGAESKADH